MPSSQSHRQIRVTEHAHELIQDLEQAYCRLAIAPPHSQEAGDAYAALSQRRRELYEYLEQLEKDAKFERTVVKWFD